MVFDIDSFIKVYKQTVYETVSFVDSTAVDSAWFILIELIGQDERLISTPLTQIYS